MRREIAVVVLHLKRLIEKGGKLESSKIELFAEMLNVGLQEKYKGHWYPKNPSKGQAYRCIRVNMFHRQDPELLQACRKSGIRYSDLSLPRDLTMWVDPGEVCCRYRENNPCFSVASFPVDDEEGKENLKVKSTLERVTSDSGSVSSSEGERTSPVCKRHCASEGLNPDATEWVTQGTAIVNTQIPPTRHVSFSPCYRASRTFGNNFCFPAAYKGGPVAWCTKSNLFNYYS